MHYIMHKGSELNGVQHSISDRLAQLSKTTHSQCISLLPFELLRLTNYVSDYTLLQPIGLLS